MQLECSDESLACPVGLQSTPSSVICATVEGREILSAATTSAAVEDNGYTCLITIMGRGPRATSPPGQRLGWRMARRSGSAARATAELSPTAPATRRSAGALSTRFRHRRQCAEWLASQSSARA